MRTNNNTSRRVIRVITGCLIYVPIRITKKNQKEVENRNKIYVASPVSTLNNALMIQLFPKQNY